MQTWKHGQWELLSTNTQNLVHLSEYCEFLNGDEEDVCNGATHHLCRPYSRAPKLCPLETSRIAGSTRQPPSPKARYRGHYSSAVSSEADSNTAASELGDDSESTESNFGRPPSRVPVDLGIPSLAGTISSTGASMLLSTTVNNSQSCRSSSEATESDAGPSMQRALQRRGRRRRNAHVAPRRMTQRSLSWSMRGVGINPDLCGMK